MIAIRRSYVRIGFLALALSAATSACRHEEKGEAAPGDASATPPASAPAVAAAVVTPAVDAPSHDETDDVSDGGNDAGHDGGRRKRRGVGAGVQDAGAVGTPSTAEEPIAAPPPEGPRGGKHAPLAPMGNEVPYGGAAPPVPPPALKNTPLPNEDPWGKSGRPTR